MPSPPPAARTKPRNSDVGILADKIRRATDYLITHHKYGWDKLRATTGSRGSPRLHKNSVLKIRDLRYGYAVMDPKSFAAAKAAKEEYKALARAAEAAGKKPPKRVLPRVFWIPAAEGESNPDGNMGRYQWFWNPQVDTFEKLERILDTAKQLGFDPDTQTQSQPTAGRVVKVGKDVNGTNGATKATKRVKVVEAPAKRRLATQSATT